MMGVDRRFTEMAEKDIQEPECSREQKQGKILNSGWGTL